MNKKNNEQNNVKYGFYYYSCNLMVVSELLKAILAGCRRIYTLTVEGCYKMAPWAKVEADNRAKKLVMKKSKQGD